MTPRLTPLPEVEWDDNVRTALAGLLPRSRRSPGGAGNALATLVRHPELTKAMMPLTAYLLMKSTLPARLRELAILRVATRRDCVYELAQHTRMAARAGLSAAEIEAAGQGKATGELESAVLTAADELDDTSGLSDATWTALTEHLTEQQVMDLVVTVSAYTMIAMTFNALGVRPEEREVEIDDRL
jgi:4-carboxymuconolactone decarboxylase